MKRTVATLAVVLLFPVANARADVVGLASSVIDFGQVSFSGIQIDSSSLVWLSAVSPAGGHDARRFT